MLKTLQMGAVGEGQAMPQRPTATRSRSDSLTSVSSRPAKRARSVSSQIVTTNSHNHAFDVQHGNQYHQSVMNMQQHPPLQQQQGSQSASGNNNNNNNNNNNSGMGIDVAAFGLDTSSFSVDGNIDPALRAALENSLRPRSGSASHFTPNASVSPTIEEITSFADGHDIDFNDSSLLETTGPKTKSKRNAAMEDNEQELRRLANENADVPLTDLAGRVRNDENLPHAEKTRQIFGMAWLNRNCEKIPESTAAVPRNRVYAHYVSMCANERIKPLNPASFGKLVRLIFPDIKTRRLGVRGQSKYHYCGIRLVGDSAGQGEQPNVSATSAGPIRRSETPIINMSVGGNSTTESRKRPAEDDIAPAYMFESTFHSNAVEFKSTPEEVLSSIVYFPSPEETLDIPRDLILPNINLYAPHDTDSDTSATLAALYRSHCTSLLEAIRFLQVKKFFQLFISFQGTLTAPVQKLFTEPCMAQWVQESDWIMYQEMIRMLSPHSLSVVPPAVLNAFRQISNQLPSHLRETFITQPPHVLDAKLMPATMFSNLLDRMLRVNEAAHASARILVHPPDRDLMRRDWEKYVGARAIVFREVPCRAPEVEQILQEEVLRLLFAQHDSMHDESRLRSGLSPEPSPVEVSTESILDHWVQFLSKLPARFPRASPRIFMMTVGAVAAACLRDITMGGGEGFGGWWVVKCWVDEWLAWTSERSGFLSHTVQSPGDSAFSLPPLPNSPISIPTHEQINAIGKTVHPGKDHHPDDIAHDDSGVSLRDDLLDEVGGPEHVDSSALEMAFES